MLTLLLALIGTVQAAPHPYFVGLSLGLTGVYGVPSTGGGVGFARATAHLPWLSIDVYGGEGLGSSEVRTLGTIGFGLRRYIGPVHLRLGFAHHHETLWDDFLADPGGAIAGTGDNIRHRSGVEVGAGYTTSLFAEPLQERLGLTAGIDARWFPDAWTSPVYVVASIEAEVRLGKPRAGDG